jgi:hypothetical protein
MRNGNNYQVLVAKRQDGDEAECELNALINDDASPRYSN